MLKLLPPDADLISATVDEILAVGTHDFSPLTVVFPSRRMRIFLSEKLNSCLDGKTFRPPVMVPVERFVCDLFLRSHPGFRLLSETETAFRIYQCLPEVYGTRVYAGGEVTADFASFYPWSLALMRSLEELLVEARHLQDIDAAVFRAFADLGDYHQPYKKFIAGLPSLVTLLRQRSLDEGWFTRGLAYRMVADLCEADSLDWPPDKGLIFSGLHALNRCEEIIMSYLRGVADCRFIMRSDARSMSQPGTPWHLQYKSLVSLGFTPRGESQHKTGWDHVLDRIHLYRLPNGEAQMLEAANILRRCITEKERQPLKRIAVILPDPSALLPFIHDVVSRLPGKDHPSPVNITLGYPFVRTPLYLLVRFMLDAAVSWQGDTVSAEAYLQLIRHPYVKLSGAISGEEEPLKRGIHRIEEIIDRENLMRVDPDDLKEQVARSLDQRIDGGPDVDAVITELSTLHSLFMPRLPLTIQTLLSTIRKVVAAISDRGASPLFLKEYSSTLMEALDELDALIATADEDSFGSDMSSLAAFLEQYLSDLVIHFEGSPLRGIQVMGLLEARGLCFDEVIVVDAVEGVLPENRKYDPFLPSDIRRVFGMRGHEEWETLFAFNFFALIAGSGTVHVLWTEHRDQQEAVDRSRFIERIQYEMGKQRKKRIPVGGGSLPFSLSPSPLRSVPAGEAIRRRMNAMALSPSGIETYIRCPLRFYFSRIARLKERDALSSDPGAGELGAFIHGVLEQFYRDISGEAIIREPHRKFQEVMETCWRRWRFSTDSGVGRVRYWVLARKLWRYIEWDLHRLASEKVTVIATERTITVQWPLPGLNREVSIGGILDRIEGQGEQQRVIDYKTGNAFSCKIKPEMLDYSLPSLEGLSSDDLQRVMRRFINLWKNFQILLYTSMLARASGFKAEKLDAAYVFLKSGSDYMRPVFVTGRKNTPLAPNQKMLLLERFKTALSGIIEEMFRRECFAADPNDPAYCSRCPFQTPCGNV